MGQLYSKLVDIYKSFNYIEPARIVMLGLDAAGKTTVLYKLKFDGTISTVPTIGFNVETVQPTKHVTLTVWDVGGQHKIRQLWQHYFNYAEGLFYVVDSSDVQRLEEAREEFYSVVRTPEMKGVPVVVMANKQDMPDPVSAAELASFFSLDTLADREWHVEATCATTGQGLTKALERMAAMVKHYHKQQRQQQRDMT